MNGARYLESLRDERAVWLDGERIADVTTHPAFSPVCRSLAAVYDLQCAPPTRDAMTYELPDGRCVSYSYLLPRSGDDLLKRRRNAELWAQETFGMVGRFADFCAALIVGLYDQRDILGEGDPRSRRTRWPTTASPRSTTSRSPTRFTIRPWTRACGPSRTLIAACAWWPSATTASWCGVPAP